MTYSIVNILLLLLLLKAEVHGGKKNKGRSEKKSKKVDMHL